jgi:hypothetical protein
MIGKPHILFKKDRTSLSPTDAAQQLVKLIKEEIAATGYGHAYTGTVNSAFTRSGGTVAEYVAGIDHGIEAGLFTVDDSGTRVKIGRHTVGWKRAK